jgi:hypothetical protein
MMKINTGEPVRLHYTFGRISGYKEVSQMLPSLRKFNQSEVAKERQRILNYYDHYGGAATFDAFGVDRKLIYVWRQRLRLNQKKPSALVPDSTIPKTRRQMEVNPLIINFIKNLREHHYRLGKEKIKVLLDDYCDSIGIDSIAESTIGKVIKRHNFFSSKTNYRIYHNPASGWVKRKHKTKRLRIKRSSKYHDSGHIIADTIERITDGVKEYFYCALDHQLKFGLALNYKTKTSRNMVDFYDKFKTVYPLTIKDWQTDNGGENLGEFEDQLIQDKIPHYFSYPRCPKINSVIERFNRTLQEDFVDQNLDVIRDKPEFNRRLADYIIWYNTKRPHRTLGLKSPINYLIENNLMSNKSVTSTIN